jgi:outer membrane protein OmpA-like peptidoglycan-associated protein
LDHWNIAVYPSVIGVKKYMGSGFSFGTRFSLNKITSYGNQIASDNYYNIDGVISYNLRSIFKSDRLMPFLEIGGGYVIFNEQGAGYFNLGVGIEYWLGEKKKTGIILESLYKNTGETYGIKHFQHMLGVAFLLGKDTDSDGDGIIDKVDKCPEVPGLVEFEGCPDQDGDGIPDMDDECPDSDGDGIPDKDDECPEIPGIIDFNGCPDSDGDGVQDSEDSCPEIAGIPALKGCPDSHGDDVKDNDDKCPEIAGPINNEGCPRITEKEISRLQEIGQVIYFETNQDVLTKESTDSLDEVYSILVQYPSISFEIVGHTDSIGKVATNQLLSEQRAASVLRYLDEKGISSSKLESTGYGETRPLKTNSTPEGRRFNRRVEFIIK